MLKRFRDQVGTAGFIISIIALVAALGGGAYAANAALSGKQKKEVEKIAKKYAGKPGAAGPAGPPGGKGDAGAPGANGSPGANGTSGTSPVGTAFTGSKTIGGTTCSEGGVEYKGASTNIVCNGEEGIEGSPWTLGGTLPKGATEKGTWAFTGSVNEITTEVEGVKETVSVGDTNAVFAPISFTLPLSAPLDETHVHYIASPLTGGGPTTECPGSVAHPKALEGQLCVYEGGEVERATFSEIIQPSTTGSGGAFESGALVKFVNIGKAATGVGSWAVTGN